MSGSDSNTRRNKPPNKRRRGSNHAEVRSWMHQALFDLPHECSILSLGSEQAYLAPYLAEYSANVAVLDTSAEQVAQMASRHRGVAFMQHLAGAPLPFRHERFDAVWCCDYLDRVFEPTSALREIHRVLVPAGRLIVTVPDHGRLRAVLIALFNWDGHFALSNPRIRYFTRTSLAKLVREVGFGEISTGRGGAVRRIAGRLVPRTLLLRARKDPTVWQNSDDAVMGYPDVGLRFGDDLAYAGRLAQRLKS